MAFSTIQQLYEGDTLLRHGVLNGYSRLRGVSLVSRGGVDFHIVLGACAELNPGGTVWVAGLVGFIAVEAADRGVGAGRALFAVGQIARVELRLVGASADSAHGCVFAAGGWVAILLTEAALGTETEGDVFFHAAFSVADDELLTAKIANPDIASQGHDDGGCLLVDASLWGDEPAGGLGLGNLGVVGGDTGGNLW